MKAGLFFLAVLCVLGAYLTIVLLTEDRGYSGTNITFDTNEIYEITVNAENVTLEAASGDFFALRKANGETIFGSPAEKPLGWDEDEYLMYGPAKVQGGLWIVEKGDKITLHLSGAEMTVYESMKNSDKVKISSIIILLACLIWFWAFLISS